MSIATEERPQIMQNKLREYRGKRTQTEVAEAVGVTKASISLYESGEIMPSKPVLEAMCAYFECDIGDLFSVQAPD